MEGPRTEEDQTRPRWARCVSGTYCAISTGFHCIAFHCYGYSIWLWWLQAGERAAGSRARTHLDRGAAPPGTEAEPQTNHQQGQQGQIQVLAEVLPQGCFLLGEQGTQLLWPLHRLKPGLWISIIWPSWNRQFTWLTLSNAFTCGHRHGMTGLLTQVWGSLMGWEANYSNYIVGMKITDLWSVLATAVVFFLGGGRWISPPHGNINHSMPGSVELEQPVECQISTCQVTVFKTDSGVFCRMKRKTFSREISPLQHWKITSIKPCCPKSCRYMLKPMCIFLCKDSGTPPLSPTLIGKKRRV